MYVWKFDAAPRYLDTQRHGPGPRSTPTYHEGKLYCLLPMGEFYCLSADEGKLIWKADIFKDTGATNPHSPDTVYYWGLSLSPLVEGDLVIVQPGGNQKNSVVAYHKDSGKIIWGAGEDPIGYASPLVITVEGQRQLVCPTGQSILGLDPRKGSLLWRYAFGNRFNATCATPVWADNLLLVSAAYRTGAAALELVRVDDKWEVREKWTSQDLQNLFATSMVLKGHIYGCHGDLAAIQLRCVDLKTGTMKWTQRQAQGRCTLLAVEGHLLCLSERGSLQLIEANPDAHVLKGELPGLLAFRAWSTPVLANGLLYVRDQQHAVCVDLRKE
jgi:outer membrane protein assembly factor BamB